MDYRLIVRTTRYYLEHPRFSTRLIFCYLAFALGCTVGLGIGTNGYVLFALFVVGCIIVVGAGRDLPLQVRGTIAAAIFFVLGIARSWVSIPIEPVQDWYSFTGVVSAHPEQRNEDTVEHIIHVPELSGKVLVSSQRSARFGDRVRVDCGIRVLSQETFLRYWQLRSRGVKYACDRNARLEIVEPKFQRFYAALADAKRGVEDGISRYLPEPERTLALGILIGERGSSDSKLAASMRRVGLSHIAVVSGYNVALIGTFVFAVMFLAGFGRRTASILTLAILIVFTLFVGLDPSVVRSVVMYSVTLFVYFLDRPKLGFYVLCLTAFVLLLFNPFLIRNVSFLLSFASVTGLSLTTEFWKNAFRNIDEKVREFLVPTFAAQTGALPVVIWYFGSLSIISPLTNVLVLPLIPFAMALSFGTWVLSLISFPYAGWISYPVLTTIVHVSEWFAKLSFASVGFQLVWQRVGVIILLCLVYGLVIFRRAWMSVVLKRFPNNEPIGNSQNPEVEVVRVDEDDISDLK